MLVVSTPATRMGWLCGAVATALSSPVAVVRGAMDAIQGYGFQYEAESSLESAFERGADFGDKHGDKILIAVGSTLLRGLFHLAASFRT